jgi:HSP20 family protein
MNIFDYYFPGFKNEAMLNVRENDKSYLLELRAVGLTKDDIKITFEDNVLVIKSIKPKVETTYIRHEFWDDMIDKRIQFPADADIDSTTAKVENGILYIEIQKAAGSKKEIQVQ